MAATAKVVELALQQRPHILVGRVAVHARTTAGIVVVIMVAKDAILSRMIRMRERHRQYWYWTLVVVTRNRFFPGDRGAKNNNHPGGCNEYDDYCLHAGKFLRPANKIINTLPIAT
jgi:hypothetical protein